MRTSALFGAKNIGFFEIFYVSAQTRWEGGRASADILRTSGKGQFYAILCGCLLWTAPKHPITTENFGYNHIHRYSSVQN